MRLPNPIPRKHFRDPQGFGGRMAARLMARASKPLTAWLLEQIDPRPDARVLEVGFAHGQLLRAIADRASDGFVAGVDRSAEMVAFAGKRHAKAVGAGVLELKQGTVSEIPYDDATFDAAVTADTVYFWPDLAGDLQELRRVLRDGGRLLVAFRAARHENSDWHVARSGGNPQPSELSVHALAEAFRAAGFREVQSRLRHLRRVPFAGSASFGVVTGVKAPADG